MTEVTLRPVGIVHSRFTEAAGMPIQTAGAPDEPGTLDVFAEFAPALRDIGGFDYLILITHLDRAQERLEVVPFLDNTSHGAFATRAPARPNRLGLSIVKLLKVEGTTLHFTGNDMMDGTPVLDIKPYVPKFDVRETDRVGWFGPRLDQLPRTRSDDRMG